MKVQDRNKFALGVVVLAVTLAGMILRWPLGTWGWALVAVFGLAGIGLISKSLDTGGRDRPS